MKDPTSIAIMAQVNATHPNFVGVLRAERDEAIKQLVGASDLAVVHRAQGRVQLLDEQINLLVSAHKLLRK